MLEFQIPQNYTRNDDTVGINYLAVIKYFS